MTLYHGTNRSEVVAHEGMCLTRYAACAGAYGANVYEVEISDDLVIESCDGYDWDTDDAPADDADYRSAAAARGVDVLVYDDADQSGTTHDCYRLVSIAAVAGLRVLDLA